LVRPSNQLRKIVCRKGGNIDDGNPMKTPPVSGGLHPANIGQFDEAVRCNPCAETPPLRLTGFEIGEFPTTHSVDKKIVGLFIQSFGGTRKPATKGFKLRDVHERTNRRLTNEANRRQVAARQRRRRGVRVERKVKRLHDSWPPSAGALLVAPVSLKT
jgi:hypothetical protein